MFAGLSEVLAFMNTYKFTEEQIAFLRLQLVHAEDEFFDYLRDAFDVHYAEGDERPSMMSIGMHCRILGRPGRLRALQHFLDHIQLHDRVWVTRRIDIARHWKATHPFDAATAFVWE